MRTFKTATYLIFIILFISCKNKEENLTPKPKGKYLSEIWAKQKSAITGDSIKYASFEYDSKRYLRKIKFYNSDIFYYTFSYNTSGKISCIKSYDNKNKLTGIENITYKNDSTMLKEKHHLDSNKMVFQEKSKVVFDEIGRPIKIFSSSNKNLDIDSVAILRFCRYDQNGNLSLFYDTSSRVLSKAH